MPNTVNTMWPYPTGSEQYAGQSQHAAAAEFTMGTVPVAETIGVATTPLYPESTGPQPAQFISEAIPADRSEAVLHAREVLDAISTPTTVLPEGVAQPEQNPTAAAQAAFYGPAIDTMREGALSREDLTLAA